MPRVLVYRLVCLACGDDTETWHLPRRLPLCCPRCQGAVVAEPDRNEYVFLVPAWVPERPRRGRPPG